jgi:protein dispatched 1
MSEILLSLPIAWFILRVIFQVKYFAGLNLMCIFIVCAVGADDIFVFMDAYVQSQFKGPNVNRDMETRFSWVYRKSGLAMLITSATTCAAFLCCLGTPLPDTQAFGIFAALVIAVDYILVITMYCTSVMLYHNRFEKNGFCSCNLPTPMGTCKCQCCIEKCNCSKSDPSPTEKALTACRQHEVSREPDKMEQFFREKFAPLILHPKARIVILLVALAWLIPAIIFVFKLRPTTKPEQFLKSNHPFQKAINALNSNFGANSQDPGIDIYYVWGLKDLDRSGVNVLVNTSYLGKAQYADSFKFDTACQDKIYQICKDLKFDNTTSEYLNMIQRNKKAQGSVKCFLFDLKDSYLAENPGMSRDNPSRWAQAFMAGKVPEVDDEETTQMVSREQFYNERYMHVGWNGAEVRFVAISIEAKSITEWDEPAEDFMQSQYKMYDDLRHNMNHIAKEACGSEVLMTDGNGKWVFMNNQRVYRTSSIRGALIGVGIALAVLLMCTRDLFISFLATLSILCTLLSVIGFVTMVGWELGSTEGILITILAGFAVDYVVHLAHAYSHNYGSSTERLTETFAEMGSPVFSGMCTSILVSHPPSRIRGGAPASSQARVGGARGAKTFTCRAGLRDTAGFAALVRLQPPVLCQIRHLPVPHHPLLVAVCQLLLHGRPRHHRPLQGKTCQEMSKRSCVMCQEMSKRSQDHVRATSNRSVSTRTRLECSCATVRFS